MSSYTYISYCNPYPKSWWRVRSKNHQITFLDVSGWKLSRFKHLSITLIGSTESYPFEKQGQKQLLFAESCLAYFCYNWEQAHCFRNESIIYQIYGRGELFGMICPAEYHRLCSQQAVFHVLGCVSFRQWDMFPTIANPKCIVSASGPSYLMSFILSLTHHWKITHGSPEGGVAAAPYCWHGTNSCHLTWIGLWHWRLYLERKSFSPSRIGYEMPDKIGISCTNSERNTRPGDTSMSSGRRLLPGV